MSTTRAANWRSDAAALPLAPIELARSARRAPPDEHQIGRAHPEHPRSSSSRNCAIDRKSSGVRYSRAQSRKTCNLPAFSLLAPQDRTIPGSPWPTPHPQRRAVAHTSMHSHRSGLGCTQTDLPDRPTRQHGLACGTSQRPEDRIASDSCRSEDTPDQARSEHRARFRVSWARRGASSDQSADITEPFRLRSQPSQTHWFRATSSSTPSASLHTRQRGSPHSPTATGPDGLEPSETMRQTPPRCETR